MKTLFTFALILALIPPGPAQAQVTGAFSAAPLWPMDGDISRYPGQFVFLKPALGEYVVAITAQDGHVERLLHAPIHNQVAPDVTVTTSIDQQGRFHYRYSLSNGVSAAMPIQRWVLAVEEGYSEMEVSHPIWHGGPVPEKLPGIARANHQVVQWLGPPDGEPLAPGKSLSGFEIVSDLAPGYVLAAFYGKASTPDLTAEDWESLPPNVAAQLKQCLTTAWDTQTRQIVGPRFALETATDIVEANFLVGLRSQRIAGTIPQDSAFTSRLESLLSESLNTPGTRVSGTEIEDLAKRATAREEEVISALRLTLDHVAVRR